MKIWNDGMDTGGGRAVHACEGGRGEAWPAAGSAALSLKSFFLNPFRAEEREEQGDTATSMVTQESACVCSRPGVRSLPRRQRLSAPSPGLPVLQGPTQFRQHLLNTYLVP